MPFPADNAIAGIQHTCQIDCQACRLASLMLIPDQEGATAAASDQSSSTVPAVAQVVEPCIPCFGIHLSI